MESYAFSHNKWSWFVIDREQLSDLNTGVIPPDVSQHWLQTLDLNRICTLSIDTLERGREAIWGELIYRQDFDDPQHRRTLHFHLSSGRLVTDQLDLSLFSDLNLEQLLTKLKQAKHAVEGFMILLSEIIYSFNKDIDQFENRMHQLLWLMKEKNDENILDQIVENRHEILVWKNLIIPIAELKDAIKEVFGDALTEGPFYVQAARRITRCRNLIREYERQLEEMTDLEVALSSHRGNEIVKTLTVITMLFTPVASWGALWGMNFKIMPELKWDFGYPFSLAVILLSTWMLYYYLKKKNWISSVLKRRKGKKF